MIRSLLSSRVVRVLMLFAGLFLFLIVTALILSAEARFLARAGFEESRILMKRRSLEKLVADPATRAERREAFQLVLDAREFASTQLALDAADSYTTFSEVGRDTLLLVLSASPRFELEPYVWRYPIAGTVTYKGYFDPVAALRAAARLEERGYDTYLRPAGAFSTLGWFNDPLLSTALSRDHVSLAATVIHEIAHNTLYVPGESAFNESFASFVGYRGAELFFAMRGDSAAAERAAAIWQDEVALSEFYRWLSQSLTAIYHSAMGQDSMVAERDRVFGAARDCLSSGMGGRLSIYDSGRLANRTLNNASVVAARLYRTRLALFDRLWQERSGDLRSAVSELADAIQQGATEDPYEALEVMLSRSAQ